MREAGQLALLMRQAGLKSQQKTSVSDVVTAADHAAEAYVLEQLRRCRPDDGILGEEGASVAGTSGRTWVIDPVDGTYNFLHGSTYWCSAIALKDSVRTRCSAPSSSRRRTSSGSAGRRGRDAQRRGTGHFRRRRGARPRTPLAELGAATYIHPTWLCRSAVRHALARGRDLRRRAADVRVRVLRPGPRGRRASWAAGSSTAARNGTGCRARRSSAPPAAPPTSCRSTGSSGSWREARRRCGSCVRPSCPAR